MIAETIAIICFFAILAMFFLKIVNIITSLKYYGQLGIILSIILLFLLMTVFYVSFFSTIGDKTTIVSATGTTTISNSDYRALAQYAYLVNIFFFVNFMLSFIELLLLFPRLLFSYEPRKRGATR